MITLIFPYYENPQMLEFQQRQWEAYPRTPIILVDDGSPQHPARKYLTPRPNIQLYRIHVDVRWNWIAARNLAAKQAGDGWLLMTDIDHVVTKDCMDACRKAKPDFVYRFNRVDAPNMLPTNVHANSWLIQRRDFWKIGGYDERFSGYYGSDHDFRHRVSDAFNVQRIDEPLVRYGRSVVEDASTRRYSRKTMEDKVNVKRIKRERKLIRNWKPLTLTFPWEREL